MFSYPRRTRSEEGRSGFWNQDFARHGNNYDWVPQQTILMSVSSRKPYDFFRLSALYQPIQPMLPVHLSVPKGGTRSHSQQRLPS